MSEGESTGSSGAPSSRRSASEPDESFDAIVVGAGVAGSACAQFLAEGGRRVALIDRRKMTSAGARWVNGVPAEAFDAARIARPAPPELRGEGHRFLLAPPSDRKRIVIEPSPVLEVDMRLLGDRLREGARRAGASLIDSAPVTASSIACEGSFGARRPVALTLDDGRVLRARLFVDASGLPAVVRRAVFPHWQDVSHEHLCLAAQDVRAITDDAAAATWLAAHDLRDGDVWARCGTAGGFSVLNIRVQRHEREVSILTGATAGSGTSGAQMITDFARDLSWIGPRVFGGAGALPLRRPYARLAAPGLALLGDAGCQMFPAHGSGIAIGLAAARLLADVVLAAPAEHCGDEDVLWPYAATFHRRHGALLCGYDLVRRMSQAMSEVEVESFFDAGLISEPTSRAALSQLLPRVGIRDALETARAALRAPRLTARVAATLASIPIFVAHAPTYPRKPDVGALLSYERRTAWLIGETADAVS